MKKNPQVFEIKSPEGRYRQSDFIPGFTEILQNVLLCLC